MILPIEGSLNLAPLWEEFSINEKQKLQRLIFPKGLPYREIWNRSNIFDFQYLEQESEREKGFGSPNGNRTRALALRGLRPNR